MGHTSNRYVWNKLVTSSEFKRLGCEPWVLDCRYSLPDPYYVLLLTLLLSNPLNITVSFVHVLLSSLRTPGPRSYFVFLYGLIYCRNGLLNLKPTRFDLEVKPLRFEESDSFLVIISCKNLLRDNINSTSLLTFSSRKRSNKSKTVFYALCEWIFYKQWNKSIK